MLMKPMLSVAVTLGLIGMACTQEKPLIEEVVETAPAGTAVSNEFSVAKDGQLQFKAEIVYFAYDDASLTPEGQARLEAVAEFMKSKSTEKLRVEGHCDDRGSVEYNLALGQRRADSVRKYLQTLGIDASRLKSVSFGSEQPAATGQGENTWSKNRRVEFAFASEG